MYIWYTLVMELTIKEQLHIEMKRQGVNQTEMGKRLGITRATVCNFFRSDDARLSDLERYAHAIGMSVKMELIQEES